MSRRIPMRRLLVGRVGDSGNLAKAGVCLAQPGQPESLMMIGRDVSLPRGNRGSEGRRDSAQSRTAQIGDA